MNKYSVLCICLGVGVFLGGCVKLAEDTSGGEVCGAVEAQSEIGKNISDVNPAYIDENTRILTPGSAVTLEYMEERMNITLDEEGTVVKIHCG